MTICGTEFDPKQLMSKDELIQFLRDNDADYRALSYVREHYQEMTGNELVWTYPISDGKHLGTFIVAVKEGFVSLPYDIVDKDDGELLELDDAALFDDEAFEFFIDDWRLFSDDLLQAMTDMRHIIRGE